MTGNVDIIWRIVEIYAKQLTLKSQGPKKHDF